MKHTDTPLTKRLGPRRVTTEPVTGQTAEPVHADSTDSRSTEDDNRDRLNRDKPPHY